MHIKEISISNFRGLDIHIDNLSDEFLIMGKNDAGKSNMCYALRKVLDYNIRRVPLLESDSSNHSRENINIKICLDLENISDLERASIGQQISNIEGKEYLYVELEAIYSNEISSYNETLYFGLEDKKKVPTNNSNGLDRVLSIIYIEPNYNFEKNKKNFFKFNKQENEKNSVQINEDVYKKTELMNKAISDDIIVEEMKKSINNNEGFQQIFEDVDFDIQSNVDINNIYTSLEIKFKNYEGKEIGKMGDGKEKTLSMLLQNLSYERDKKKIIIVEEPENHMYPLLQKTYAKTIDKLDVDQVIFTSHSPYIFDLKKMKQIIKLTSNIIDKKITEYKSLNISKNDFAKFGYMLNEEIAEMFFYDTVLLVEGPSEKYFYNYLQINDGKFQRYIQATNMGIFSVMGVNFGPVKEILSELGIKVLIKTDNDIFKVPKKDENRYAGLERVIDCLTPESEEELCNLLKIDKINKEVFRFSLDKDSKPIIEDNMRDIVEIFGRNDVYISQGHGGFEEDFLEFIDGNEDLEKDLKYLKKAKLQNLHEYILEYNIDIIINENNKNSILLGFMTDEYK